LGRFETQQRRKSADERLPIGSRYAPEQNNKIECSCIGRIVGVFALMNLGKLRQIGLRHRTNKFRTKIVYRFVYCRLINFICRRVYASPLNQAHQFAQRATALQGERRD
jgi:hypothetical protein